MEFMLQFLSDAQWEPKFWALVYLLVIPECLFQEALSLQGLLVDQAVLFLPTKVTRLSVKTGRKMQTSLLSCIYRKVMTFYTFGPRGPGFPGIPAEP